MKTIIVDDEKSCVDVLKMLIEKHGPDFDIIGMAHDGKKGKEMIEQLKPDVVFADIQMPVMNGIEMLENCEYLDFKLVFTTAYNEYAIKAIKMNALDYLLKPIDGPELKLCLDKLRSNLQEKISKAQITNAGQVVNRQMTDTIALSTQKGLTFIRIKNIMLLEADSSYTNVYMDDGEKLLISKTMLHFEEILDPEIFFRPHKSYLINLGFIKQYIRGDGGEIIMKNGMNIPLSRSKKEEFLSFFEKI